MSDLSRRDLLAGVSSTALLVSSAKAQVGGLFSGRSVATSVPVNQMQILPLGGGGYVTSVVTCDDGVMYCRTDVFNCYRFPATTTPNTSRWDGLNTLTSWGASAAPTGAGGFMGVWEIAACPTDSNYVYQITGSPSPTAYPSYSLMYSSNAGANWTASNLTMTEASSAGSTNSRFTQNMIAVDPANRLHVIAGLPWGSTPNGGVWRCFDGQTFSKFNGTGVNGSLPDPVHKPGCAGIVFDRQFGTVVLPNGSTVTKRILAGIGGQGYYETWDGGQTWSNLGTAPTPSSADITVTTTTADSIIYVQLLTYEWGYPTGINNVSGALTWNARLGVSTATNPYGNFNLTTYWALAPAGTYVFNVSYSAGTIASLSGVTNRICVIPIKDVDVSSGGANVFAATSPAVSIGKGAGATSFPSLTVNSTGLVLGFSNSSASTADTGYTIANNTGGFWSEYSSSALVGVQSGLGAATSTGAIGLSFDAIKQKSGGAIAIDGSVQYITSGPASQTYPVNPTVAQVDYSGTMWMVNGPSPKAAGGFWRYTRGASAGAGTWARVDGSGASGAMALGWPSANSSSVALIADPRTGHEGTVTAIAQGTMDHGWQTLNGTNTPINTTTWRGSDGYSGLDPGVLAPVVGWQAYGTGRTQASGGCVNPLTGLTWVANGLGVAHYNANFNFSTAVSSATYATNVVINWMSQGIEECLVQQVLVPPGGSNVLVAGEDREIYITSHTNYEGLGYPNNYWPYADTNGWMLDYASDNPNFICSVSGALNGPYPGFSFSGGDVGSWSQFITTPNSANILGGQIACSSASQTTNAASFNATLLTAGVVGTGPTTIATGTQTITIPTGKQDYYAPGFSVTCVGKTTSTNNAMLGTVTSYDNATGALVLNVTTANAFTATEAAWDVRLSYYFGNSNAPVLVMTGVTGTPTAGDFVIGSGINTGTYLVQQGGGSITNSWLVSDWSQTQPVSTAMTLTRNAAKIAVISGAGGNSFAPRYTTNCGRTWANCVGLPTDFYNPASAEQWGSNIVADRVLTDTMYAYSPANGFYRSTDGGANWSRVSTYRPLSTLYSCTMLATPGNAGHLWITQTGYGSSALYHSESGGTDATWPSISGVTGCRMLAMGATKPGASYPTLVIVATVGGIAGYYYSIDKGANWISFNGNIPSEKSFGGYVSCSGDWVTPGRFYFHSFACGSNWIQLW